MLAVAFLLLLAAGHAALACPFCRGVSETLSDKLDLAEVVVIATQPPDNPETLGTLHKGAPAVAVITVGDPPPGATVIDCQPDQLTLPQLGLEVSRLIRVRYGPVELPTDLDSGKWRELPPGRVSGLFGK